MSSIERFLEIGDRFLGADLQSRWHGAWPKKWRARIVASKNERCRYRVVAYGDTAEEAAAAAIEAISQEDSRK